LTGFWRTTNGGKYVFANILANPNINKLLVLAFNNNDNGHLLVNALENLWMHGVNERGIIHNCKAPNPKFEQVSPHALDKLTKQVDLLIMRSIVNEEEYTEIEKIIHALIQEPEHAVDITEFKKLEFISKIIKNNKLYDDGARYEEPEYIDLTSSAKNVRYEEKNLNESIGQSVQAQNLAEALEQVAGFVFKNGTCIIDQRKIVTLECRSISVSIIDPLEKLPEGFSSEYLKTYCQEFMKGKGEKLDEFAYTYHERIFKRWGNQIERAIKKIQEDPSTRRMVISLWSPDEDILNPSAPCLDLIWIVVRNNKLEMHVLFRSHHLATMTEAGKLMPGEGAFVPNVYALAHLQQYIAENINMSRGPFVVTDFSGHVYVREDSKK
jgi:thymidylate synthase